MNLRSENNVLVSSVMTETKELFATSISTLNVDELVSFICFLDAVKNAFKAREEIFLLVGGNANVNAYTRLENLSNDADTNKDIIDGRDVMMIVYDKVRSFITDENGLRRVTDFLYKNAKMSYKRALKRYSKGGKKDVNFPCVNNIDDQLMIVHIAKDFNAFLLEVATREAKKQKSESSKEGE